MKSEIKPISGVDDRVCLAEAIPLATPFTINIFPTNACNFRCNYCAQSLGADYLKKEYGFSYETMGIEVMQQAVEQMKQFPQKIKLVSFMGHGEPLLNPNLPEMIRLVREAEVAERIEIITNASLLTPELSQALIQAGLSAIRISLQGISAEKYVKISNVKIDFPKFIDNIRYFYSIRGNCKVFVKVVDTSLEAGEEQKFYEMFEDISDRMYVEKIKPVYAGVEYQESVQEIAVDRYGNAHEKRMVCPLTFYMLSLWPNGDVVPCDAIYKPVVLGNIKNDTFYHMWNNSNMKGFQRMQLQRRRMENENCCKCCAPDDVSHPLDTLDHLPKEVLKRWNV